ncbi:MAG: acetylxylan esterase [Rhodopirellula sp.]|nr:acetylxylan esterase [Rhodopirellula sp.]
MLKSLASFLVICCVSSVSSAADSAVSIGATFEAKDTLAPAADQREDAKQCVDNLCWKPGEFSVQIEAAAEDRGDWLVRFPSPVKSGDDRNDRVAMEWYQARDAYQNLVAAPAVVVVHESGSGMTVGRIFAKGLQLQGLHAFMLQLPFYGERRTGKNRPEGGDLVSMMKQAVADVRRARDAVAVLPLVDQSRISLQGTSLGGFVSATAGALDEGYENVFLMLAGGELYDLIQNGKKDAAKVRERLEKAGLVGEKLRELTLTVEPTRVAHRLRPDRTWLYSGTFDTVVPMKNALALANAASLTKSHHIQMAANHYTGIVYLPFVLAHIGKHARGPVTPQP